MTMTSHLSFSPFLSPCLLPPPPPSLSLSFSLCVCVCSCVRARVCTCVFKPFHYFLTQQPPSRVLIAHFPLPRRLIVPFCWQHEVALMYDAVYLLAQALERYDRTTILRPFNASCDNPVHWSSGPTLYTHLNQVTLC